MRGVQSSGKYWKSCHDAEKHLHRQLARDETLQDALWEKSIEAIGKFEESLGVRL